MSDSETEVRREKMKERKQKEREDPNASEVPKLKKKRKEIREHEETTKITVQAGEAERTERIKRKERKERKRKEEKRKRSKDHKKHKERKKRQERSEKVAQENPENQPGHDSVREQHGMEEKRKHQKHHKEQNKQGKSLLTAMAAHAEWRRQEERPPPVVRATLEEKNKLLKKQLPLTVAAHKEQNMQEKKQLSLAIVTHSERNKQKRELPSFSWATLPSTILERIGALLDTPSLLASCLVCKSWLSNFRPILWRTIPAKATRHPAFIAQFSYYSSSITHLSYQVPRLSSEIGSNLESLEQHCLIKLQHLKSLELNFLALSYEKKTKPLPRSVIIATKLLEHNTATLTSLIIKHLPGIISSHVLGLVSKITVLNSLTLHQWHERVRGDKIIPILEGCRELETLSLLSCSMGLPEVNLWELERFRRIQRENLTTGKAPLFGTARRLILNDSEINMVQVLQLCMCLPELRELQLVGVERLEKSMYYNWDRRIIVHDEILEEMEWDEDHSSHESDVDYFMGEKDSSEGSEDGWEDDFSKSSSEPDIRDGQGFSFISFLHMFCPHLQSFDFSDCDGCANLLEEPDEIFDSRESHSFSPPFLGLRELRMCNLLSAENDSFTIAAQNCSRTLVTLDFSCDFKRRYSSYPPFRGARRGSEHYGNILNILKSCALLEYLRVEPYPINPICLLLQDQKPWACRRLKTLGIAFEYGTKNTIRRIQDMMIEQLSHLTNLETLVLEGGVVIEPLDQHGELSSHRNNQPTESFQYLKLSLDSGLQRLSGLRKLKSLDITLLGKQEWKVPEIEWIASNWPMLRCLNGMYNLNSLVYLAAGHARELYDVHEQGGNNMPLNLVDEVEYCKKMFKMLIPSLAVDDGLLERYFEEFGMRISVEDGHSHVQADSETWRPDRRSSPSPEWLSYRKWL
ncbi:hypothetical protein BGX26_005330, partial [Mortierella sp. AD094]